MYLKNKILFLNTLFSADLALKKIWLSHSREEFLIPQQDVTEEHFSVFWSRINSFIELHLIKCTSI